MRKPTEKQMKIGPSLWVSKGYDYILIVYPDDTCEFLWLYGSSEFLEKAPYYSTIEWVRENDGCIFMDWL